MNKNDQGAQLARQLMAGADARQRANEAEQLKDDEQQLDPVALAASIPRFGYRTKPNADVDAIRRR